MLKKNVLPSLADINTVKRRFFLQNRERLVRTQSTLRERQRDFLELVPLLFHINHPSLPGFISKLTPAGVADYSPPDHVLKTIKRYAKTFIEKRRALLRYEIGALFLMGSSGTVAYSKKSDFDIWVCHEQSIEVERLNDLKQKCKAIEEWAMSFDLEVHFFLVEPESFRRGVHEDMSAESSGSAQHFLLMEEFYRTGLLLAGRYPLWWLIPPSEEAHYYEYADFLKQKRFISEHEYIDFGPLEGVPAAEFFGAAMWQLYKGIDSPYKSVLKLLLMESYAQEYPNIELLCHRFKREIYKGETDLDRIDPYIMLYTKIEEYLVKQNEDERLALVRRCFYFKVNEPLSVPVKQHDVNWRRELLLAITQSWAWGGAYLEMLDSRQTWKIDRVLKERTILVKALTYSYRFLSDFARKNAQLISIDKQDLNVLGRKLYAAFERKAGKVDIINRGISGDLWESHLSFYRVKSGNSESWLLFAAPLNVADITKEQPLRRSHSLIELLAWCHFNNVLNANTVLAMHSPDGMLTGRELKEMLYTFQHLFATDTVLKTTMQDFSLGAKARQVAIFVNLGVDPLLELTRQGKQLLSNKSDALSYGGLGENLAVCFDMVTITSWKEVLTSRYTGVAGLIESLRDYLRWSAFAKNEPLPEVSAHCFLSGQGLTIRQRVEELFCDVIDCFYGQGAGEESRYVVAIEQDFYLLVLESGVLHYDKTVRYGDLLTKLGEGGAFYRPTVIDRYALQNTLLPNIFAINKRGVVQIFYRAAHEGVDIYILDERGALFYQKMAFIDREAAFNHFKLFFDSILNRQSFTLGESRSEVTAIRFYEVVTAGAAKAVTIVKREVSGGPRMRSKFDIQVIGDIAEGKPVFTIYCDDRDFSSIEYDTELFREVARYVLSKRRGGERYPIYIGDMDLPPVMLEHDVVNGYIQTIHYLKYKRRIEGQLNEALNSLSSAE